MAKYELVKTKIDEMCKACGVNHSAKTYANFMSFMENYVYARQYACFFRTEINEKDMWKEAPNLFRAMVDKEEIPAHKVASFLGLMIKTGQMDFLIENSRRQLEQFYPYGDVFVQIIDLLYLNEKPCTNKEAMVTLKCARSTFQEKKEQAVMIFGLYFWQMILSHWDNSINEMKEIEEETGRSGELYKGRMCSDNSLED